ncbi:hypothetical protein K439DRAFT_1639867 [Ramaria rubella]|nr:hypothetical protein K439DRAFT_1639867 [Ramaria rubella]
MSNVRILLRALPNVEFVHGFPGIPAGPDRPHATIRGAVEVRLGTQAVKAKWVKVELRKIETIPSGNRGEEFVDLVGQGPITVWQAQHESDTLSSKDFPFNIRVPETLPPSVALERGAGIKYEVVATLVIKGKKGLFRREASTPICHRVPVVIDKHELHSTWPIYAQPEARHVASNGLILAVDRTNTCFAPGDRLSVIATLKSESLSPVVLRGLEFSLKETIVFQSHGKKNGPNVQTMIISEQKTPVSMTIYGGTQHKAELSCIVPGNHTTSSVNTGRHIDIGYSLNIKAIIDLANPVAMDLPVTITNWPRHVSAEMTRRIGTAPNLSLKLAPPQGTNTVTIPQTLESRSGQMYGPPRPPPSGGLPSLPNGSGTHTIPPGALPPGQPGVGQAMNPYSFQQNPYSTPNQTLQQGDRSPRAEAVATTNTDVSTAGMSGTPDEFGYNSQSGVSATMPSRQSEKGDTTDTHRAATTSHRPSISESTNGDFETSGPNRISLHAQDVDPQENTPSGSRRNRTTSRTPLKIMNANDDIPEEESPIKREAPSQPFDNPPSALQRQDSKPTSATTSSPLSATPWPTADDEKQRLYEKAKAKAERAQARARMEAENLSQSSPPSSNDPVSPLRQSSPASQNHANGDERPITGSSNHSRAAQWPTAEEEKQRLFERAKARVHQTHGIMNTSPISTSTTSSTGRPSHQRGTSHSSSQDSHLTYTSTPFSVASVSKPAISAGAALYSHAMSSITRPSSAINTPVATSQSSNPRRNASLTGSNSAPPAAISADEKSALRYYNARKAVEQRQRGMQLSDDAPQEGPIPYEELFGASSDGASPAGTQPQLSEKEALRRAYEARDAATTAASSVSPSPVRGQGSSSMQIMTTPHGLAAPLSEKEVLRRAFEARDAAIMRSGQTPPPALSALQPPPPPPSMPAPPPVSSSMDTPLTQTQGSSSQSIPNTSLSDKERMRLAFEARDRALAAQQAPQPPGYDIPPPPPVWSESRSGPITAAEEKSQLKARYATEDANLAVQPTLTRNDSAASSAHARPVSSHGELLSVVPETSIRRDPTISAGKKRASQMIAPPSLSSPPPPPPLPPRPPAEYIEETKLEDRRNTLAADVILPPSDFSSSFDLGFDSFEKPSEQRN